MQAIPEIGTDTIFKRFFNPYPLKPFEAHLLASYLAVAVTVEVEDTTYNSKF